MRLTRADRSVLSDWWFTVDRPMFFALLLLMGAGMVLSLAASPPIAAKFNVESFYFVRRHAVLLLPAAMIMFVASVLTPKQIRRASLVIFAGGIGLMVLALQRDRSDHDVEAAHAVGGHDRAPAALHVAVPDLALDALAEVGEIGALERARAEVSKQVQVDAHAVSPVIVKYRKIS